MWENAMRSQTGRKSDAAWKYRPIQPVGSDSLKALAQSCTPIFKAGPIDEKRAAAFLDMRENQRYPTPVS
jgi:hypothetical protein